MLTSKLMENHLVLIDIVPRMSQLLNNTKPLQTRISEPTVPPPYLESAYHWLAKALDELIGFVDRDENSSVSELTENDYNWVDAILQELICSISDNKNHSLDPLMEFVIRLIVNYEDKYVPKLTEMFPELAKKASVEVLNKNSKPPRYASELSDDELAAHAFFSIGCLLWEGGKAEKALSAYDTAIRLQPDYAEVYNNRGNIKNGLGYSDDALDDYDDAICFNPNFAEVYSNRGSTKFHLGKQAEALTDLNDAIQIKPDYAEAYANRAEAKISLGNIDEAKLDFKIAFKLAKQHGQVDFKAYIEKRLQEFIN